MRERVSPRSVAIQFPTCSRRPARSSTPIAGSVSTISNKARSDTKLLPISARISPTDLPAASPLTMPATTTTGTGLKRNAKPITTTSTPSNGSQWIRVVMATVAGASCRAFRRGNPHACAFQCPAQAFGEQGRAGAIAVHAQGIRFDAYSGAVEYGDFVACRDGNGLGHGRIHILDHGAGDRSRRQRAVAGIQPIAETFALHRQTRIATGVDQRAACQTNQDQGGRS